MDTATHIIKIIYGLGMPIVSFYIFYKITKYIDSKIKEKISLGYAFLNYLICLFLAFVSLKTAYYFNTDFLYALAMVLYFSLGVYLNKVVLRRFIDWKHYSNTLTRVTFSKLMYVLFWPVKYLFLLVTLSMHSFL